MDFIQQQQADPHHTHQKHKYSSYIFMVLSCVTWVLGYVYCNEHNIHPVQTSITRGFMIMVVSYALCKWEGVALDYRGVQREVLVRNVIFLAQAYIMAAIQFYLPLGVVHTLGTTGPIFVSVFQYIFQGKKPHAKQLIGMALTFLGIILTANGRLISKWIDPSYKFDSDFSNYRTNDMWTISLYSILFICFYILWGYAVYSTNKITSSAHFINFHFGLKLYILSSLIYPILVYLDKPVNIATFYWQFLWSGLPFALAEACFVLGIMLSSNIGMTIMLGSSTILIAYFFSIVKYHESVNAFCVLGSVFIVLGLSRIILE